MTPHLNRLNETVLMMGHKICFYGEICIIIFKSSLLPFLIWSTGTFHDNSVECETTFYVIQFHKINKTLRSATSDTKLLQTNFISKHQLTTPLKSALLNYFFFFFVFISGFQPLSC